MGAVPYLIVAVFLWNFSPIGVISGLMFGQFHIWWRHSTALGWQTWKSTTLICQLLFVI
jgi:hypothetical protein